MTSFPTQGFTVKLSGGHRVRRRSLEDEDPFWHNRWGGSRAMWTNSLHGLVALFETTTHPNCHRIYLGNILNRTPRCIEFRSTLTTGLAIGFHPAKGYKVVRSVYQGGVDILDLGVPGWQSISDLHVSGWRGISGRPRYPISYDSLCVQGTIYWMARSGKVLITFDLLFETFGEVALPSAGVRGLGVYEDSLIAYGICGHSFSTYRYLPEKKCWDLLHKVSTTELLNEVKLEMLSQGYAVLSLGDTGLIKLDLVTGECESLLKEEGPTHGDCTFITFVGTFICFCDPSRRR